jgi:hypothetical protein
VTANLDFSAKFALLARRLRTDLSNFHLLHYRSIDGFLVTGKNSGTHWLRCMLSHALAHQFDLPAPDHTSGRASEDFIGHPRWRPKHAHLPHIGSSHTLPSAISGAPLVRRLLGLPPVVVLVRSIPDAMLSHYVKWGAQNDLSLADYVHLPAPGRRDLADVWWYIDFFNRWGAIAQACPRDVLIVRYEDLRADTGFWLERVAAHLGLQLGEAAVAAALAASDRDFLRARLDPAYGETIVPDRKLRESVAYSADDQAYLRDLLRTRLKFDFGYGHADVRRPCPLPTLAQPAQGAETAWSQAA